MFFHQISGSCSAHPSLNTFIFCSLDGSETTLTTIPLEHSVRAALINEVPISKPRLYKTLQDGWTVETKDGRNSAQWEHTLAVTKNGVEVLTKRHEESI